MDEEFLNSSSDNSLSESQIKDIYQNKLATQAVEDFDVSEDCQFITTIMLEILPSETLQKATQDLQTNFNLVNVSLVSIIKSAKEKRNYKNVGIIFITFCDFFDLDLNRTYIGLHEKIKTLIVHSAKNFIGKRDFIRIENKIKREELDKQGYSKTTLFELLKK